MFDLGFTELLMIGIVALLVIGPERLPKVARTAGSWIGRLNRYVSDVKQDIDRDMRLDELRKLQEQMRETAQKYEIMAGEMETKAKSEVNQVDKLMQAMTSTSGSERQLPRVPEAEIPAPTATTATEGGPALPRSDAEATSQPGSAPPTPPSAHPAEPAEPARASETSPSEPPPYRSDLNTGIEADDMRQPSSSPNPTPQGC
jgi:sec-independent protein translocase protein TatB